MLTAMPDIRMARGPEDLSALGRRAAQARNWAQVNACAAELLRRNSSDPEGHFLAGLVEKAATHPLKAAACFARALEIEPGRYDAAVELANQHAIGRRNAAAAALLEAYEPRISNSPRYLDLAGTIYVDIGLPERAWPLYVRACELQPDVTLFQGNRAACSVYLGKIEEAKALYRSLLEKAPNHQRNHYQLSRLERARDTTHIEQMKAVLAATKLPPDRNVFLYYAIGKELEDLEQWAEAFRYYKLGGDAVAGVARYDGAEDIQLIDRIIEVCNTAWLQSGPARADAGAAARTPIFIVGLPRTGTTLTERILASHSQVESLGETQFLQMALRQVSGVESVEGINPATIESAAKADAGRIADGYLEAVAYRLGDRPMFIEKLPFNFLYVGFIARTWPHARIVHLRRHPMDTCFSMYKQVFTWAYKFSYQFDTLGRYFIAHERLARHWRALLGERLIEVEYESLVAAPEEQTRRLLERVGLAFEPACLDFDRNQSASTTASSVQVREKINDRSIGRWRHFEQELRPLRDILEDAGITVG